MRFAIGATIALFMVTTAAAGEFSSLEERMSQAEFRAAGLDRLSPQELKALDDWLRNHNAVAAPTASGSNAAPQFYPDSSKRELVESRIDGQFSGWSGHSVFKLENGQEWEQAESGSFSNGSYDHPVVKVKPTLLGSWLMSVEKCGCSVRVKRKS